MCQRAYIYVCVLFCCIFTIHRMASPQQKVAEILETTMCFFLQNGGFRGTAPDTSYLPGASQTKNRHGCFPHGKKNPYNTWNNAWNSGKAAIISGSLGKHRAL